MIYRTLQQAREVYEQDVLKHPNYHDGAPRKTWDELDSLCKESCRRHPLVQFDEASREAWEERAANDGTTKASMKCRVNEVDFVGKRPEGEQADAKPSTAQKGQDFDDSLDVPF